MGYRVFERCEPIRDMTKVLELMGPRYHVWLSAHYYQSVWTNENDGHWINHPPVWYELGDYGEVAPEIVEELLLSNRLEFVRRNKSRPGKRNYNRVFWYRLKEEV